MSSISDIEKSSINESMYGSPFIVLTEGGCSGTTAVGYFIGEIVAAHGLTRQQHVHFEFLNVHKKNKKNNKYKNKFFQDIVKEQNMTHEQTRHDTNIIVDSIQRAQKEAKQSESLIFFKANVAQYHLMGKKFNKKLDGVSYASVYRNNALDRCICMVRDCFYETRNYGSVVFGANGTKTDLCINRREHPEVNVQAKFKNIVGCIEEDQIRVNFLKDQLFDSFSSESLFEFENSLDDEVFETSVNHWMEFLKPLMRGVLDRSLVANVLQEQRGSRSALSSQASKVYNYDKVKDEVKEINMEEELLHV